jgi:hypothetical protein
LSLLHNIGVRQYRHMSKSLIVLDGADTAGCCSQLTAEPMSQEQAELAASVLKALADPVRLRLMSLIAAHIDGEAIASIAALIRYTPPWREPRVRCAEILRQGEP